MLKGLAIAGVFVVVVAAILAYFVGRAVMAASDAQSIADSALESARKHTLDYDNQLKFTSGAPSLNSNSNSSPDFAQIKQAADSFAAKADQVRVGIRTDRARLGSADRQLQTAGQNRLAALFRPGLDRSQRRVESVMFALDAADTAVGIERDEMHAISAFMDMMSDYVSLDNKEKAGDVSGSLAVFTTLDPKVQATLQAMHGQDIPAQATALVEAIATTVADEKAVLQATQAHDANRVR